MAMFRWMVTLTPLHSSRSGWVDWHLDHCWGELSSILGHQVASQNYGGPTIMLDLVKNGPTST